MNKPITNKQIISNQNCKKISDIFTSPKTGDKNIISKE